MQQLSFFEKPSFHNTIQLKGQELIEADRKASGQKAKVLKVFQQAPYKSFTPAEVHIALGQQFLLTSVRRSISDLTKENLLELAGIRRMGVFGQMNQCWKLKANGQNG